MFNSPSRVPANTLCVGSVWSTTKTQRDIKDGLALKPVLIHHVLGGAVSLREIKEHGYDRVIVKRNKIGAGGWYHLGCVVDGALGYKASQCSFLLKCSYLDSNIIKIDELCLEHNEACLPASNSQGTLTQRQRGACGR